MALYDTIGNNYAKTRKSNRRIAKKLLEILASSPDTKTIIDIGAGTGSYANVLGNHGYSILAVEPSVTMRNQKVVHPAIEWIDAYAEKLPLSDKVVDAAIVMLAFHHFTDYQQALKEINRVVGNGQMVFFTYNPAMISRFWLTDYFPSFIKDVESVFLPIPKLIGNIQAITQTTVDVIPFRLPKDLSDSFAAVGWGRPELYLDSNIRNGISSFRKIDDELLNSGLSRLRQDLETGRWDLKYGYLRQQNEYDAGYCFIHRRAR